MAIFHQPWMLIASRYGLARIKPNHCEQCSQSSVWLGELLMPICVTRFRRNRYWTVLTQTKTGIAIRKLFPSITPHASMKPFLGVRRNCWLNQRIGSDSISSCSWISEGLAARTISANRKTTNSIVNTLRKTLRNVVTNVTCGWAYPRSYVGGIIAVSTRVISGQKRTNPMIQGPPDARLYVARAISMTTSSAIYEIWRRYDQEMRTGSLQAMHNGSRGLRKHSGSPQFGQTDWVRTGAVRIRIHFARQQTLRLDHCKARFNIRLRNCCRRQAIALIEGFWVQSRFYANNPWRPGSFWIIVECDSKRLT